ncbi:helix-turn-helix domain-containing protein [Ethanoligenens sp.]|uniref:helix-turn-helix domain-containing protein n=1 Tax=Ethanoligenens sp. TaxID=2099655 RepID=UPI0039E81C5C
MPRKLRALMIEKDIDQKYLCERLGKSQGYISARITCKKPWSMNEVYKICNLLGIQYEDIPVYFPPTVPIVPNIKIA